MIYNKSGHPIEVKKISIRIWSLRDEIEAALERRMKECEAAGIPLFVDDIKSYYNLNMTAPLTDSSNVIPLRGQPAPDDLNSIMASLKEDEKVPETGETKSAEKVPADPAEADNAPKALNEAEKITAELSEAEKGPKALNEAEKVPAALSEGEIAPKAFNTAEEIIAEQNLKGIDTKKPNPILERPYQRQAPDLEKIFYGFTFLSDIYMESFLSFTQGKFLQGQSVVVEFLIPQHFMMTADVTYCHYYALRSRIISSTKPDYRVQCKFNYALKGERENLRNFLKSIEPTVIEKKKTKKESEDDILGI